MNWLLDAISSINLPKVNNNKYKKDKINKTKENHHQKLTDTSGEIKLKTATIKTRFASYGHRKINEEKTEIPIFITETESQKPLSTFSKRNQHDKRRNSGVFQHFDQPDSQIVENMNEYSAEQTPRKGPQSSVKNSSTAGHLSKIPVPVSRPQSHEKTRPSRQSSTTESQPERFEIAKKSINTNSTTPKLDQVLSEPKTSLSNERKRSGSKSLKSTRRFVYRSLSKPIRHNESETPPKRVEFFKETPTRTKEDFENVSSVLKNEGHRERYEAHKNYFESLAPDRSKRKTITKKVIENPNFNLKKQTDSWVQTDPKITGEPSFTATLKTKKVIKDPVYDAVQTKTVLEGPNYDAVQTKTVVEGPKYDVVQTKTVVEGTDYDAVQTKTEVEEPNYDAVKTETVIKGPNYQAVQTKKEAEGPEFDTVQTKTIVDTPNYHSVQTKTVAKGSKHDTNETKTVIEVSNYETEVEAPNSVVTRIKTEFKGSDYDITERKITVQKSECDSVKTKTEVKSPDYDETETKTVVKGPDYDATETKTVVKGPDYDATETKTVVKGPDYDATETKTVVKGPDYDATETKTVVKGPDYDATETKTVVKGPDYDVVTTKAVIESDNYNKPLKSTSEMCDVTTQEDQIINLNIHTRTTVTQPQENNYGKLIINSLPMECFGPNSIYYIPEEVKNLPIVSYIPMNDIPVILSSGGQSINQPHNYILSRLLLRFQPLKNEWQYYGVMPEPLSYHGMVILNMKVYIIGGKNPSQRDRKSMRPSDRVYCLDLMENSWTLKCPMREERACFGAVTLNGKIYAIGGIGKNGVLSETVECYDPLKDQWMYVKSLPYPCKSMAVTAHKGLIFVIGGMTPSNDCDLTSRIIPNVLSYDANKDEWEVKNNLNEPRACATVEIVDNQIWLCNGCKAKEDKMVNYVESVATIEVYKDCADSWETKTNLSHSRFSATSAELGSCVFIFGGINSTTKKIDTQMEVVLGESVKNLYLEHGKEYEENHSTECSPYPFALTGVQSVNVPSLQSLLYKEFQYRMKCYSIN